MKSKLGVLVCSHLSGEVRSVVAAGAYPDVEVEAFPAHCGRAGLDWRDLKMRTAAHPAVERWLLLPDDGLNSPDDPPTEFSPMLERVESCCESLLGPGLLDAYRRQGACLLTPGGLSEYRRQRTATGSCRRGDFGADIRRLVLLETGIGTDASDMLQDVAAACGLPAEVLPVGVDRLALSLERHILRWRLERQGARIQAEREVYRGGDKDITALRFIEEELAVSQAIYERHSREYQTILDGIPDNLIVLDPHFNILWANQAALRCAGSTLEEAIGSRCYEIWHRSKKVCETCTMARSLESGEVEEALVTRDGITWGNKAFPIKDEDGKVIRVIELGSDITEKLRLREESQRAGRLASLGELAAGVAHEINNPNALILLNAPILAEACADILPILEEHFRAQGDFPVGRLGYQRMREELPRLIEGVGESAKRIKRIVDDLKDFVRRDDVDTTEPLDFNAVVQAAVRLVANTIKKATGRFETDYAAELPRLRGRAQGIEQVVVNLIVNACQALPSSDRGITVTTGYDIEHRQVFCKVRDEGAGIAPENLPYLTDPFFTTRREDGGTGLGLSVSARIVKEHGGKLVFDSQPGRGTTVVLTLPVANEGAQS
jgi:PAS domain S-box-containing protein